MSNQKATLSWKEREQMARERARNIPNHVRAGMSHDEKFRLCLCVTPGCHRYRELASVCEFHYYQTCHRGRCNSNIIVMGTVGARCKEHIGDCNPVYGKENLLFFQTGKLPQPPPRVMEERKEYRKLFILQVTMVGRGRFSRGSHLRRLFRGGGTNVIRHIFGFILETERSSWYEKFPAGPFPFAKAMAGKRLIRFFKKRMERKRIERLTREVSVDREIKEQEVSVDEEVEEAVGPVVPDVAPVLNLSPRELRARAYDERVMRRRAARENGNDP